MLDIGFVHLILFDGLLACRIEDFLLDRGMHHQLGADLLRQRGFPLRTLGGFELLEQVLDLAMVGFQEGDRVACGLCLGHGWSFPGLTRVKVAWAVPTW